MNVGDSKNTLEAHRVFIETHGCQMNEYDSGIVNRILKDLGYRNVDSPEKADVILLNTCAVREKAHEKIKGRMDALAHLKKKNPELIFGILGCMAQNLGDEIFHKIQKVDLIVGPDNYRELPELLQGLHENRFDRISRTLLSDGETYDDIQTVVKNGVLAFVTVMRGCNNFCSFCVVPYTRGKERSRPPASIIKEIRRLTAQEGVREVTLLGQNVNSYLYQEDGISHNFVDLLKEILKESHVNRIRFTSPHPHDFPLELLELMAKEDRICSSIHLPVQSGSTSVLRRMKRDYSREEFLDLVNRIYETVPGIGITTDVIVGFSGETDEEFRETVSLMEKVRFQMAYMFKYSERMGTIAYKNYADDIPENVKLERLNGIIELQMKIGLEVNLKEIGRVHSVLVEGTSKRNENEFTGRTSHNRVVIFPSEGRVISPGDFVNVRISSATAATLRGEIAGEAQTLYPATF